MSSDFPASFTLSAMLHQRLVTALVGGIEAAVRLYYDDYSDATTLDGAFYAALQTLSSPGSFDLLDTDLDELIEEVERKIQEETGRSFDSLKRPEGD